MTAGPELRRASLASWPVEVIGLEPLASGSWGVRVRAHSEGGVPFVSGQYFFLSMDPEHPELDWPLSVASPATRPHVLEFCVSETGLPVPPAIAFPSGRVVSIRGPAGRLRLRADAAGHLFVAAGTGISAIRSMLLDLWDREDRTPIILVYGHRTPAESPYLSDLRSRAGARDHLRFVPTFSRDPAAPDAERGRVTSRLPELREAVGESWAAYICGGEAVVRDALPQLRALGLSEDRVLFER